MKQNFKATSYSQILLASCFKPLTLESSIHLAKHCNLGNGEITANIQDIKKVVTPETFRYCSFLIVSKRETHGKQDLTRFYM